MLKCGLPHGAIRHAMIKDGVDPSLLHGLDEDDTPKENTGGAPSPSMHPMMVNPSNSGSKLTGGGFPPPPFTNPTPTQQPMMMGGGFPVPSFKPFQPPTLPPFQGLYGPSSSSSMSDVYSQPPPPQSSAMMATMPTNFNSQFPLPLPPRPTMTPNSSSSSTTSSVSQFDSSLPPALPPNKPPPSPGNSATAMPYNNNKDNSTMTSKRGQSAVPGFSMGKFFGPPPDFIQNFATLFDSREVSSQNPLFQQNTVPEQLQTSPEKRQRNGW